jgi:hypothetical protein
VVVANVEAQAAEVAKATAEAVAAKATVEAAEAAEATAKAVDVVAKEEEVAKVPGKEEKETVLLQAFPGALVKKGRFGGQAFASAGRGAQNTTMASSARCHGG